MTEHKYSTLMGWSKKQLARRVIRLEWANKKMEGKNMTYKEAIRLIDPKTSREALVEIAKKGGDAAVIKATNEACLMACEALRIQEGVEQLLKDLEHGDY